jgi:hypothetical protein
MTNKCEENRIIQAKLKNLENFDKGVGDADDSPSSSITVADDGHQEGPRTNLDRHDHIKR